MKIVNVKSDQYAGMNKIDQNFKDGLNVITGDNASGKSTIIDLIFRLLFQNVKLSGNSTKDNEFVDKSFPYDKNGEKASFINGTVVIEFNGEQYILEKQWDLVNKESGYVHLTPPNGAIINDVTEIEKILTRILVYGEGTYRETVFSSQRDEQHLSKIILGSDVVNKDSLSAVLALDSIKKDGVQLDDVKNAITEKCLSLYNRWDLDLDKPRDKNINTDKKDKGSIFKCYSEVNELKEKKKTLEGYQTALDGRQSEYESASEKVKDLEKQLADYGKYGDQDKEKKQLASDIERLEKALTEARNAKTDWPDLEVKKMDLESIRDQLADAVLNEKYTKVIGAYNKYIELKKKLDGSTEIKDSVIEEVESLNSDEKLLLEKLQGIGIIAKYTKLSEDSNIVFSYVSDNEEFELDEKPIDRAFKVSMPKVFELQFEKQGYDVEIIKSQLEGIAKKRDEIFTNYGVANLGGLKVKQKEYGKLEKDVEEAKAQYERLLGDDSLDSLEERMAMIKDKEIKSPDAVKVHLEKYDITEKDLPGELAHCSITIETLEKNYISQEELGKLIDKLAEEKDGKQEKHDAINIPDWVSATSDEEIRKALGEAKTALGSATSARSDAKATMANSDSIDELNKGIEKKEQELEDLIKEGKRWRDIDKRFQSYYDQKKMAVTELQKKFVEYLTRLTDDGIKMNSDIDDDLKLDLVSNDHKLNYNILSAGTEETIDFAFRLAILDDVFKGDNGFAVFDDPFVNMDPTRVNKAAELLVEFAKNNQVIFVTCDPKYIDILSKIDKKLNVIAI